MSIDIATTISGVVLAAGESRRMGIPKAICSCKGGTFLEAVVSYLQGAGIASIGVVLGAAQEEIRNHGLSEGIDIWINPNYRHGQLSSLQVALANQTSDVQGVMVALVDHPAVSIRTVSNLIEIFNGRHELVVKPQYQGRGGHPILIGRQWWSEILDVSFTDKGSDSETPTLRDIFHRHPERIVNIQVNDPGIHLDIDTPEILARHTP